MQLQILRAAVQYLRPGGYLVYSTCTLTLEENEEIVKTILEEVPELELCEAEPRVGDEGIRLPQAQRLYPHKTDTVGFFLAKLRRVR